MLDVARKMLTEASRNPVVATVEKEAGWLLVSSLLSSMPKEVSFGYFNCVIIILDS